MPSNNPPSIGYSGIWQSLNNWPAFTAKFRLGPNTQINAQASGYTPPVNANVGDRPAVRLGEGKIHGRFFQRNSKSVEMKLSYPLEIMSGSFGVDTIGLLNTIALQALGNAGVDLGQGGILYSWELQPGDTKQRDTKTMRAEWVTAGAVVVTFLIPRTDFLSTTYT